MTARAEPTVERYDAPTLLKAGGVIGVATAAGVVLFALLSRALEGPAETVLQSVLVLLGGAVFAYGPAAVVRPRAVDGISWTSLTGLLGALTFTVLDFAVLRPLSIYDWTWDQIGGGSGFWYIPVWWMGSATLAWLGGWIAAEVGVGDDRRRLAVTAAQTTILAVTIFGILGATVAPFSSAVMALGFAIALVVHLPLAKLLGRR